MIRAITLPVIGIVVNDKRLSNNEAKEAWKELREQLKRSWQRSTMLANWATQELMKNDVIREPDQKKLPKMPKIYLYGIAKDRFDLTGWSQSAGCVLRTIEMQYRARRYERIWLGQTSLPNTRYPYPWPMHNQTWKCEETENEMRVNLPLHCGRVTLVLKRATKNKNDLRNVRFQMFCTGEAKKGEAAIYQKGDDLTVKLVGTFPERTIAKDISGVMHVRTDKDAFLLGFNAKDEKIWDINGDWFRKVLVKHDRWQNRFRDDMKLEDRLPKQTRVSRHQSMRDGARKFNARQKTFVEQTVAKIVNYAVRRKIAEVKADFSETSYFRHFVWFEFTEKLRTKCQENGITFFASGDVMKKTKGPLAKNKKADAV